MVGGEDGSAIAIIESATELCFLYHLAAPPLENNLIIIPAYLR